MFCIDLIIIIASSSGIAARARNKGHVGFLFGVIHFFFAFGSEVTGVIVGLFIGMMNDPFLDQKSASVPMFAGAAVGLTVGILFMFFVVALLPQQNLQLGDRSARRRTRQTSDWNNESNYDGERRET